MIKRLLIAIMVVLAMLSIQGCNKTWSVYFNSVDDLNHWELQNISPPYETYISSDGLYLDGMAAHAPYGFEGDFTLTLVFDLAVGENNDLNIFQIVFSGGEDSPITEYIMSNFMSLGSTFEDYYNAEQAPYKLISSGFAVPGLERNGKNTYTFIRKGNNIKAYMNKAILFDYDYTSYSYTVFFPTIFIDADSHDQIAIRSIKVVYDGDTTVYPRP